MVVAFDGERVFLQDLGIAPTFTMVELGDRRRLVLGADLADTVLVAVEFEQAPIDAMSKELTASRVIVVSRSAKATSGDVSCLRGVCRYRNFRPCRGHPGRKTRP